MEKITIITCCALGEPGTLQEVPVDIARQLIDEGCAVIGDQRKRPDSREEKAVVKDYTTRDSGNFPTDLSKEDMTGDAK